MSRATPAESSAPLTEDVRPRFDVDVAPVG